MKFLVLLFLVSMMASDLFALSEGDRVRLWTQDDQVEIGQIYALRKRGVWLAPEKGDAFFIPYQKLTLLEKSVGLYSKSKAWGKKGFYGGALVGAGLGSFLVNMCILPPCPKPTMTEQIGVPIATGGLVGGLFYLIGRAIGKTSKAERWQKVPVPFVSVPSSLQVAGLPCSCTGIAARFRF